jgi:uncharacterized lipoprotein YddW (UPF0748 family)
MRNSFLLLIIILFSLPLYSNNASKKKVIETEFRGVWISTVNNIDWPSEPGLPVEQQKKELIELINRIDSFNLNTVIFQVRPAADALYYSETEPWSYYLTGKQGKAPEPFYDPLKFAIDLCHKKGIKLHAWFNPFRIRNDFLYRLNKNHRIRKSPHWVYRYGEKWYLDPGIPQVRQYIIDVIMEVVRKYDIDAVHLDDYFYPYPARGEKIPDGISFELYGRDYSPDRINEWRRSNINSFIEYLSDTINKIKPEVALGVSPFGVWRHKSDDPKGSSGKKGLTSYDDLNVDILKWLENGWIDYAIPQLYWKQKGGSVNFNDLSKWWNKNSFGKQLYIGLALYMNAGTESKWKNPYEIHQQVKRLRKLKNIKGFSFFSASHLSKLSKPQAKAFMDEILKNTVVTPVD